jgi:hypothetical protein
MELVATADDDDENAPVQGFPALAVDPRRLLVGVVMEVDDDDAYWQHYTTRHDSQKYARLKEEIRQAILGEFKTTPPEGLGSVPGFMSDTPSPLGSLAVYNSPPPPRCGAFEVSLLIAEVGTSRCQAVLLHSKLNSSRFPSTKNIVGRLHALFGTKLTPRTMIQSPTKRQYGPTGLPSPRGLTPPGRLKAPVYAMLDKHHGVHPCELCGRHDYSVRLPLWDRYNFADSKEHGFRADTLYRVDLTAHSKQLTRYGVRWVGDCCYSRWVGRCASRRAVSLPPGARQVRRVWLDLL